MTINFFFHLTITILGYAILAFSYLGLGWVSSLIFRINFPPKGKLFFLIWLGWAMVLVLLQVLNVFIPIAASSSVPLFVLGIIFAVVFFKMELFDKQSIPFLGLYTVLVAVLAILVAIQAMFSPTIYDSGLYHFNSIRWLNEYPVVLGLGNLHGRLAYNQSFFTFVAYLNLYPIFNHGYSLANSFLLLILLAECAYYFSDYVVKKDHITDLLPSKVIAISFIPILIFLALNFNISSPSPDIASSIIQILLFIHFSRTLDENSAIQNHDSQILFIFILSAIAITIKLSNLFYVLSLCTILLIIRWKVWQFPRKQTLFGLVKLMALPTLIIGIWCFRGILSSGCPAYPSTFACLNVDWAVPIGSVKSEADWIYSWARVPDQTPDKVLSSWAWVEPWIHRMIQENKITILFPLIISIAMAIVILLLYRSVPLSRKINKITFLLPLPIVIGLVFWFFLAPNVRFAHALFSILPVSILIVLIKTVESSGKVRNGMIKATFFILIAVLVMGVFIHEVKSITSIPTMGYMPIPEAKLTIRRTLSGLEVWSPTQSDQCWDSKIPCTPNFNENLNFIDNKIFPEFTIPDKGK